jgi:hypothetical protein
MARPTKLIPITVKKLEEAFALGCTDEEACIYADICKQTLYNFQEKNQEFLDRKELLKKRPILEARKAVINSFKQNPNLAFKYLEKKKRDEFGLKQEEAKDNVTITVVRYADCLETTTANN